MASVIDELAAIRRTTGLTQEELASRAGLSRMTVQRTESGGIDPRLSTLQVMARALGLELMVVPQALRPDLENFIRAGGRYLAQPAGVEAPPSVAEALSAWPGPPADPTRRR